MTDFKPSELAKAAQDMQQQLLGAAGQIEYLIDSRIQWPSNTLKELENLIANQETNLPSLEESTRNIPELIKSRNKSSYTKYLALEDNVSKSTNEPDQPFPMEGEKAAHVLATLEVMRLKLYAKAAFYERCASYANGRLTPNAGDEHMLDDIGAVNAETILGPLQQTLDFMVPNKRVRTVSVDEVKEKYAEVIQGVNSKVAKVIKTENKEAVQKASGNYLNAIYEKTRENKRAPSGSL